MSTATKIGPHKRSYLEKPIIFTLTDFLQEIRVTSDLTLPIDEILKYCYQYAWLHDITFQQIFYSGESTILIFTEDVFIEGDQSSIFDYKFYDVR